MPRRKETTALLAILLSTLTLSALPACAASASTTSAQRPNILWIIADDLSPDLGCYGDEAVSTPNIDRVAHEGARYTNAFATAPVCSSSRSAFITGVYQTTTGTHQHRTMTRKPLPDGVAPITELFRKAGYFVANGNSNLSKPGKGDYNFSSAGKMYDGHDWRGRKAGQPFFAQVQIFYPHRVFHGETDTARRDKIKLPPYLPDHPVTRADWSRYLSDVERLDAAVGKVLDRLEADGLADNTVVFFFGDHGRPHVRCKQWLYDGGIRVPLLVRWPKHVKPGTVRDELVSLIDVSAASLAAARIELPNMHGVDMLAPGFKGRDAIYAARDRSGNTVDRVRCVRTERFKYVRNFHPGKPYTQPSYYKLIQYPVPTLMEALHAKGELTGVQAAWMAPSRPAEELYDIATDPHEINNLADDPAYTAQLAELRDKLDRWITETKDRGEVAEDPADEKAAIESSTRWYRSTMKKRGIGPDDPPSKYLRWWRERLGLTK